MGSVWEELVSRSDVRKGLRIAAFMETWAGTAEEWEREPDVELYSDAWGIRPVQVRFHLDEFRVVYPGEQSPSRLMTEVRRLAGESSIVALRRVPWRDVTQEPS